MKHDFADGKYTVEFDEATGRLTALRHGEPWGRDLVGDKLVLSMLQEVDRLRLQVSRAYEVLTRAYDAVDDLIGIDDEYAELGGARLREDIQSLRREMKDTASEAGYAQ